MNARVNLISALKNTPLDALNQNLFRPSSKQNNFPIADMPGIHSQGYYIPPTEADSSAKLIGQGQDQNRHYRASVKASPGESLETIQNIANAVFSSPFLRPLQTFFEANKSDAILGNSPEQTEALYKHVIQENQSLPGIFSSLGGGNKKVSAFLVQAWPHDEQGRLIVDTLEINEPRNSSWEELPPKEFLSMLFNSQTQDYLIQNLLNPKIMPPGEWRARLASLRNFILVNPHLKQSLFGVAIENSGEAGEFIRQILKPALDPLVQLRQSLIDNVPPLQIDNPFNPILRNLLPAFLNEDILPHQLQMIETALNRYSFKFIPTSETNGDEKVFLSKLSTYHSHWSLKGRGLTSTFRLTLELNERSAKQEVEAIDEYPVNTNPQAFDENVSSLNNWLLKVNG